MRIVIVGAGAVGALLGAMLVRAGSAQVAFVARGAARDRLRARGASVTTPTGAYDAGPFEAEEDPAALGAADAVFVATKSFQVRAIAPRLAPLVAAGGVVVPLQNGVDAADTLGEALGAQRVLGGLCHVLAAASAPACVTTLGAPLRVTMGELYGSPSLRVRALGERLTSAGVGVRVSDDVRADVWEKLLFVGPMGLVGAATGLTADRYRALPDTRALVERAMREVWSVAVAHGIAVPEEAIARSLALLDSLPPGSATSMQKDLAAGRPSEIEEQIGAVVRAATTGGLVVPIHETLYAVLRARAAMA